MINKYVAGKVLVPKEQIDVLIKILDIDGKTLFNYRQWFHLKEIVLGSLVEPAVLHPSKEWIAELHLDVATRLDKVENKGKENLVNHR